MHACIVKEKNICYNVIMNTNSEAVANNGNTLSALSDDKLLKLVDFKELECRSQFGNLLSNRPQFLKPYLKDQEITDLGCGHVQKGLPEVLLQMGAKKYIGVDPAFVLNDRLTHDGKVERKRSDALTYLREKEDGSSVIMGNWIFNEILGQASSPEKMEYLRRVMREIYRVTPSVCFGYGMFPDAKKAAEDAGFSVYHFQKYTDKFDIAEIEEYPQVVLDILGATRSELDQMNIQELNRASGVFGTVSRLDDFYILKK